MLLSNAELYVQVFMYLQYLKMVWDLTDLTIIYRRVWWC